MEAEARPGATTRVVSWPHTLAGLALALALLVFFLRGTDWSEVGDALRRADPGLLGLAVAVNVGVALVRAARWRRLLAPVARGISLVRAWRVYVIGLGVSTFVAGRLGDLVRPYLVTRDGSTPFSSALATVVAEHVFDLLAVLGLFAIVFVAPEVMGSVAPGSEGEVAVALLRAAAAGYAVLGAVALAVITALALRGEACLVLLTRVLAWVPGVLSSRLLDLSRNFALCMAGDRRPRHHLHVVGATVLVWAGMVLGVHLHLEAFDLQVPLHHAAWLAAALALGVIVPTPGGVGTYHATSLVVVGELWGLGATDHGAVVAFTILSHLNFSVVVSSLAPWYLVREGFSVRQLATRAVAATATSRQDP